MEHHTSDLRITGQEEVLAPVELLNKHPVSQQGSQEVFNSRAELAKILHKQDPRIMLVVGPCSIHDPRAAIEYAGRLAEQAKKHADYLMIVMRAYFEKPRTTVGWKGLANDPRLDGSCAISEGLRQARKVLLDIIKLELPAGTEYLDPITPQYIGDLVSWAAIGSRTTESQIHRQLASGLSCPVGFKNGTSGTPSEAVQIAVDAVSSASHSHSFLGVTKQGRAAIFSTSGNKDCHIVLRGSREGANYDRASVEDVVGLLKKSAQKTGLMVDMSHANSGKDYRKQIEICGNLCRQIVGGNTNIIGTMIESNLVAGRQDLVAGKPLIYGQSITDACLGWDDTVDCIKQLAEAVKTRKTSKARLAEAVKTRKTSKASLDKVG